MTIVVTQPRSGFTISDGFVSSKIYDKRLGFEFDIVFFFISIRFSKVSSHVAVFNNRNKIRTAKLLQQGNRYHKFRKAFSKFYLRHYDLVPKCGTQISS